MTKPSPRTTQFLFQGLLIATTVLPYLVASLYNILLFRAASDRVRTLIAYPGSRLIDTDFFLASGGGFDRYWNWALMFQTNDDIQSVTNYFDSSLLATGWSSETAGYLAVDKGCSYPEGVDARMYALSNLTLSMPLRPVESQGSTVYCLYISARFSTLFDLRYSP